MARKFISEWENENFPYWTILGKGSVARIVQWRINGYRKFFLFCRIWHCSQAWITIKHFFNYTLSKSTNISSFHECAVSVTAGQSRTDLWKLNLQSIIYQNLFTSNMKRNATEASCYNLFFHGKVLCPAAVRLTSHSSHFFTFSSWF